MIAEMILQYGTVEYYDDNLQMHGKFKLKDNVANCDLLCTNRVRNQHVIHTKDEKNGCWRHKCVQCGRTMDPSGTCMLPESANIGRIFDDFYGTK